MFHRLQGANPHNVNTVVNNYTVNDGLGMLTLNLFLYLIITWYADKVFPSEYGVPLPPWFPFTASTLLCLIPAAAAGVGFLCCGVRCAPCSLLFVALLLPLSEQSTGVKRVVGAAPAPFARGQRLQAVSVWCGLGTCPCLLPCNAPFVGCSRSWAHGRTRRVRCCSVSHTIPRDR